MARRVDSRDLCTLKIIVKICKNWKIKICRLCICRICKWNENLQSTYVVWCSKWTKVNEYLLGVSYVSEKLTNKTDEL